MRILTIGTFDLLHDGHRGMFHRAARIGELTVGVNTDRFVTGYKGAPAQTETERLHAVAELGYAAVLNDGPGRDLIHAKRPDVLAIGPDWLTRDYLGQIGMTDDELFGLDVVLAFVPPPRQPGLSSSEIRRGR